MVTQTDAFGLAVVILSYGDDTKRAEEAARSVIAQNVSPAQVVIVHNPAHPETVVMPPDLGCVWLPQERNLGYSAGMNAGIRCVTSLLQPDLVLLMTHDSRLLPEALRNLLRRLRSEPVLGLVGPVLKHADSGDIFSVGGFITATEAGHITRECDRRGLPWIDGSVLLVRKEVLESVLFDESLFMYWEDVEFSRVVREHGWLLEVVFDAEAVQSVGLASRGRVGAMLEARNRLEIYRRSLGWGAVAFQILVLLRRCLALIRRSAGVGAQNRSRHVNLALGTLGGIAAFGARRFGPPATTQKGTW